MHQGIKKIINSSAGTYKNKFIPERYWEKFPKSSHSQVLDELPQKSYEEPEHVMKETAGCWWQQSILHSIIQKIPLVLVFFITRMFAQKKKETVCYRIQRKKIYLLLMDLYYWLIWVLGIVIPIMSKFCVFSTTGPQVQSCHSVISILFNE